MNKRPKSVTVLGFKEYFNSPAPENRLSLLNGLCKKVVLGEIAALKYRLKPKEEKFHNNSAGYQFEELYYFCGQIPQLYLKYLPTTSSYFRQFNCQIFSRATCLFAFEEISNSDLPIIPGFTMAKSWEQLLIYLLAVNNKITRLNSPNHNENNFSLEDANSQLLPLNELLIEIDPLYVPYRGLQLMKFLSEHLEMGPYLDEYFASTYQIPFDNFIYEILNMYLMNNKGGVNNIKGSIVYKELDTSFYYSLKNSPLGLFPTLSKVLENGNPETLLSTKKYPFYPVSDRVFILSDNILLLEKCYSQFINDFWFDKIRTLLLDNGKPKYPIATYRSYIGRFMEKYLASSFARIYHSKTDWQVKVFDELLVGPDKARKELADIYIRQKGRILLGQVKSTGLYDAEKYSGNLDEFYKGNRAGFFSSFGIDQIVQSLVDLDIFLSEIDSNAGLNTQFHVYPVILVNEKALQTPVMAQIFNIRFQELLHKRTIAARFIIERLSLIHIGDWEQMEEHLGEEPEALWTILNENLSDPFYIPPFFHTLNLLDIKPRYRIIKHAFEELINKFRRPADSLR